MFRRKGQSSTSPPSSALTMMMLTFSSPPAFLHWVRSNSKCGSNDPQADALLASFPPSSASILGRVWTRWVRVLTLLCVHRCRSADSTSSGHPLQSSPRPSPTFRTSSPSTVCTSRLQPTRTRSTARRSTLGRSIRPRRRPRALPLLPILLSRPPCFVSFFSLDRSSCSSPLVQSLAAPACRRLLLLFPRQEVLGPLDSFFLLLRFLKAFIPCFPMHPLFPPLSPWPSFLVESRGASRYRLLLVTCRSDQ